MRYPRTLALIVAAVGFACSEPADRNVTEPALSPRVASAILYAPCDPHLAQNIRAQIATLFGPPQLATAIALWNDVEVNCSAHPATAKEMMLKYVQFTIDQQAAGTVKPQQSGTVARAILSNWDLTFPYVGYEAPQLSDAVFGPDGAVGVIAQSSSHREISAEDAALSLPVQNGSGDPRGHLFSITPASHGECLGDSNLDQYGPCFDFESFPHVTHSFSPGIKVGVCQPVGSDDQLPLDRPALGHLTHGNQVEILQQVTYPTFCEHTDAGTTHGSWNGGFNGIATRLAWLAKKGLGVRPLYAVHGGLGGVGGTLSPFGAVDLTVFVAPLNAESIGAFPATPRIGAWMSTIQSPASITVASSLGAYNDTVIVLSTGTSCDHCKGPLLRGLLADSAVAHVGATYGTYDVRWVSVQGKSAIKKAPFVVRDVDGRDIATLVYSTESSHNRLRFNGVNVGTWVQNQPQAFTIRVSMNAPRRASLLIDGVPVGSATNLPFVNLAATGLGQIVADFRSQDSGIMGWAEVSARRLVDQ